jgi:hypothetical protein
MSSHQIPLTLNLEFFPVFTMFFPPWIYFCHLITYIMHGRIAGYLPTISETGTGQFGHIFQYKSFATISLTSLYTGLVITWYVFCAFPKAVKRRVTALFFVIVGSLNMLITGCASMIENHGPHFLSAGLGLAMMIVWQFILYHTIFDGMTLARRITRMCYILIQGIALIVIERSDYIFSHRISITIATIAEYCVLFFLQCFYISFYCDIQEWRPILVMALPQ